MLPEISVLIFKDPNSIHLVLFIKFVQHILMEAQPCDSIKQFMIIILVPFGNIYKFKHFENSCKWVQKHTSVNNKHNV